MFSFDGVTMSYITIALVVDNPHATHVSFAEAIDLCLVAPFTNMVLL